jgi:hypothetical protein
MIKVSKLTKKELKASYYYIEALGKLLALKNNEFEHVLQRLQMIHILDEAETNMLILQLKRIS